MRYRVTALDGLNVRLKPTISAARVGLLRHSAIFDDVARVNDALGNSWHVLTASASGAPLRDIDNVAADAPLFCAQTYAGNTFTELADQIITPPPPPPPPISSTRYKTGIWARTRFDLVSDAFEAGCRFAVIMDNFAYAAGLAERYPDAIVLARRYLAQPQNVTTVDQAIRALEGAESSKVIYTLFCEESGRPLEAQFRIELDTAREIERRSGARFAALTSSMGTPDFTNPRIVDIMRKTYALAYNAREMAIDMHLYSPTVDHLYKGADETRWYETRWRWLFDVCGFSPKVREVYCTETGLDEGGVGGFPAHSSSSDDVIRWVRKNEEIQSEPYAGHPSPIVGGALFQLGDLYTGPGGWGGYAVDRYFDALKEHWRAGG